MASATAVRSITDAVASSASPTDMRPDAPNLAVIGGSGEVKIPYILAPSPAPHAVQITGATFKLTQKGTASTGSRTLSLYPITQSWREGNLSWKTRPSRGATPIATVTVSGAGSDGRVVSFDLTAFYQSVSDGSIPNYGFTVESSTANTIVFYSSESISHQPRLEVSWSNRPAPPTDPMPAGGALVGTPTPPLRWGFLDVGGDTTLAAVQVQIKATNTGWTDTVGFAAPDFDSGAKASTQPQFLLDGSLFAGIVSGSSVWWTARHQDGSGLWSNWLDPQNVGYLPYPPGVALLSPGPDVHDTTFPWVWTATDQVSYQLLLTDENGHTVWDSGIVTEADDRSFTQPRGIIKTAPATLTAELRLIDTTARQAVPGFPRWVSRTQTFTYTDSAVVEPFTGLDAYVEPDSSDVLLVCGRSTVPDQMTVWIDGKFHTAVDGADVVLAGDQYQILIQDVPPRIDHEIVVKAVVTDGDTTTSSIDNPSVLARTDPIGVRLVDTADPTLVVVLLSEGGGGGDDIVNPDMPDVTELFQPVGSSRSVPVTSVLRWFEGSVSGGYIADYGDLAARTQRDALLAMKATPLVPKVLVWGRNAVPVYISAVVPRDVDIPGGERYDVSFNFVAAVPSPEYVLQ